MLVAGSASAGTAQQSIPDHEFIFLLVRALMNSQRFCVSSGNFRDPGATEQVQLDTSHNVKLGRDLSDSFLICL